MTTIAKLRMELDDLTQRKELLDQDDECYDKNLDALATEIDEKVDRLIALAQELEDKLACQPRAGGDVQDGSFSPVGPGTSTPVRVTGGKLFPESGPQANVDVTGLSQKTDKLKLVKIAKPQSFNKGDNIDVFLEQFERFITLGNFRDQNLDFYFLSLVKDEKMYMKLRSVKLSRQEKSHAGLLVAAYKRVLYPEAEVIALRNNLALLKQSEGESIEEFSLKIERLVEKVYPNDSFGPQAALTTFLNGLTDVEVKRTVLQKSLKTFRENVDEAVKVEKINRSLAESSSTGSNLGSSVENHVGSVEVMRVNSQEPMGGPRPRWDVSGNTTSYSSMDGRNAVASAETWRPRAHSGGFRDIHSGFRGGYRSNNRSYNPGFRNNYRPGNRGNYRPNYGYRSRQNQYSDSYNNPNFGGNRNGNYYRNNNRGGNRGDSRGVNAVNQSSYHGNVNYQNRNADSLNYTGVQGTQLPQMPR